MNETDDLPGFGDSLPPRNEIASQGGDQATMSSLDIATLCEKEHRVILRDIRLMLISLYGEEEVSKTVPDQYRNRHSEYVNQNAESIFKKVFETFQDDPKLDHPKTFQSTQGFHWRRDNRGYISEFHLNYQHTLTLASGYSVKLRKAIIDRWHELEAKEEPKQFKLPSNYIEALESLVATEKARLALESTVQELTPKAEFYDAVVASDDVCQLATAGQVLGLPFGRNTLFQRLRNRGTLISGGARHNLPKQAYISQGLFTVKESKYLDDEKQPHIRFTTCVTQKGMDWLRKEFKGREGRA
jgi:phage antirepressor YoqD-like protein